MAVQKLTFKIEIKSSEDINVFHEIFHKRPEQISDMSPTNIQNVDLHEGVWGTVGTYSSWSYTHEGKQKVAKAIVESIDNEKKTVVYNVIGGDLKELYKTFLIHLHVETEGENNLVTWTFEYEKLNPDTEDPTSFMEFATAVTKDIEKNLNTKKVI